MEEKTFLENFLGTGGTGSNLLSGGLQIGLSAVQNKGKEIQSRYAVELQKLTNDGNLNETQFKLELAKLNQQYGMSQARADDEKRNDLLLLVGVVGGLLMVATIAIVLIVRSNRPVLTQPRSATLR